MQLITTVFTLVARCQQPPAAACDVTPAPTDGLAVRASRERRKRGAGGRIASRRSRDVDGGSERARQELLTSHRAHTKQVRASSRSYKAGACVITLIQSRCVVSLIQSRYVKTLI